MFYHPASNQHIREGNPFTIDGVQYPSQWLNHSTPQDKEALGLVEVTTVGTREDDRYYYVSEELNGAVLRIVNTRKSDEQIAEMEKSQAAAELRALEMAELMPRTLREYLLDLPGAAQKPWYAKVKDIDDKAAVLRGKLV